MSILKDISIVNGFYSSPGGAFFGYSNAGFTTGSFLSGDNDLSALLGGTASLTRIGYWIINGADNYIQMVITNNTVGDSGWDWLDLYFPTPTPMARTDGNYNPNYYAAGGIQRTEYKWFVAANPVGSSGSNSKWRWQEFTDPDTDITISAPAAISGSDTSFPVQIIGGSSDTFYQVRNLTGQVIYAQRFGGGTIIVDTVPAQGSSFTYSVYAQGGVGPAVNTSNNFTVSRGTGSGYGLQVYNTSGQLILDTSSRTTNYLGIYAQGGVLVNSVTLPAGGTSGNLSVADLTPTNDDEIGINAWYDGIPADSNNANPDQTAVGVTRFNGYFRVTNNKTSSETVYVSAFRY